MKLNFKEVIDNSNITQTKLAQLTGLSYPTINALYKGTAKSIYFDKLDLICQILGCTPNDVLILDNDTDINKVNVKSSMEDRLDQYILSFFKYYLTHKYKDVVLDDKKIDTLIDGAPLEFKYKKFTDENGCNCVIPYFDLDTNIKLNYKDENNEDKTLNITQEPNTKKKK